MKLIQPHALTVGILARRGSSAFADSFGSATSVHVGATGARDHVEGVFRAVMTSSAGDLIVPVRCASSLFNVDHAVVTTTLIAVVFVGCGRRDDSRIGCIGIALIASLAHSADLGTSLGVEARVADNASTHTGMGAILASFARRAWLGAFGPVCVRRVRSCSGSECTSWASNWLYLLFHAPVTQRASITLTRTLSTRGRSVLTSGAGLQRLACLTVVSRWAVTLTVRSSRTIEASSACFAVRLSRAASCLEVFSLWAGVLTNMHSTLITRTGLTLAIVARLTVKRVLRARPFT